MGQGGFITLVNSTNSDWQLTAQHSYQMNNWSFPQTIAAKTSQRIYIEWDQNIFHNQSDDGGEASYTLADNTSFQIQARAQNGFMLQVYFSNLTTSGNPQGSTLPLGWNHDGNVDFILSGTSGNYTSSNLNAADWMQDNISLLGDVLLRNMCIVGTHDAGMSVYTSGTAFAYECSTLTQSNSIGGQLMLGSRYFDIRPVISSGQYYTGHYGNISQIDSWQGANGQSIQSIISDVNNFTSQHRELVILNLSHSLNTDVGNSSYREFNQQEWNDLFSTLKALNHLYIAYDPIGDLTQSALKQFISAGPAVVVIVQDSQYLPPEMEGQGFYSYACFDVFNDYANSNDVSTMANDQIGKMRANMPSKYFLLSWTLTQNATQATTCELGTASSIKQLADDANQQLSTLLYPQVTRSNYPNIIYVDNMVSSDATAMAMAVNWLVHS